MPFEVLGAIAVGVALAALAFALWRRRRWARIGRRLRKPASRLQHPLVLTHGLMGFDEISIGGVRREYFRGVPGALTKTGALVHVPRLSPLASVAQRAQQLAERVRAIDAKKVNLVA